RVTSVIFIIATANSQAFLGLGRSPFIGQIRWRTRNERVSSGKAMRARSNKCTKPIVMKSFRRT
ncbi:unnamed protein product, partial [Heterotrigona itama]